jgi:hypothetical protein
MSKMFNIFKIVPIDRGGSFSIRGQLHISVIKLELASVSTVGTSGLAFFFKHRM